MALWNAHRNAGRKTSGFGTLRVEHLEDRNGPSSLLAGLTDVATTDWLPKGQSVAAPMEYQSGGTGGQSAENKPPKIVNFTGTLNYGVWTFTGTVEDEAPGGLTVTFGGSIPSFAGRKATTDANGNFSITVNLNGEEGEVNAVTADAQGLASNTAVFTV